MPTQRDRVLTYPPTIDQVIDDKHIAAATREEAEEARRKAAEIGDYATAERWFSHERLLATQDLSAAHPQS
jgi:hypothetical protein